MTTAETTRKSLAAKLREIVDAATGYTPEQLKKNNRYSLWGQVGEVAVALESSSESLTGLKERLQVEIADCEKLEAEYRERSKAELDDEWITADEITHRIGGLKFAQKLIEEREQAALEETV